MKSADEKTHAYIMQLREEIAALATEVADANEKANEEIAALVEPVVDATARYNEKVAEHNAELDAIIEKAQAHYDRRSEKWQDGEEGEAYRDWIAALEEARLEEVNEPDVPEIDRPDVAEPDDDVPISPEHM